MYLLSGNPEHVVLGDNVTVSLTYITDDDYNIISWINDGLRIADKKMTVYLPVYQIIRTTIPVILPINIQYLCTVEAYR